MQDIINHKEDQDHKPLVHPKDHKLMNSNRSQLQCGKLVQQASLDI